MIAGWVVLIADEPHRLERCDSAHWSRDEAIARANWLVEDGDCSKVRVVRLDPYGGDEIHRSNDGLGGFLETSR